MMHGRTRPRDKSPGDRERARRARVSGPCVVSTLENQRPDVMVTDGEKIFTAKRKH